MKFYIAGRGNGGSWQIRGQQLGQAIGASFTPAACDAAILVKRATDGRGLPIVWDVVDSWPQPAGNDWSEQDARTWLRSHVRMLRPAAIVAATEKMASDCAEFGLPVKCIVHHARPGQELNPIRERVHAVGYEGGEAYLGRWRQILEKQCAARGWRLVINPESLADLDIVVALRDATGYPARSWKSNVKLANAQATGTPFIGSPEAGYRETQSGAECWAENERGLIASLDRLEDYRTRAGASLILRSAAPHLATVAKRYKEWLQTLRF